GDGRGFGGSRVGGIAAAAATAAATTAAFAFRIRGIQVGVGFGVHGRAGDGGVVILRVGVGRALRRIGQAVGVRGGLGPGLGSGRFVGRGDSLVGLPGDRVAGQGGRFGRAVAAAAAAVAATARFGGFVMELDGGSFRLDRLGDVLGRAFAAGGGAAFRAFGTFRAFAAFRASGTFAARGVGAAFAPASTVAARAVAPAAVAGFARRRGGWFGGRGGRAGGGARDPADQALEQTALRGSGRGGGGGCLGSARRAFHVGRCRLGGLDALDQGFGPGLGFLGLVRLPDELVLGFLREFETGLVLVQARV